MHRLLETPRDVFTLFALMAAATILSISLAVALYPYIGEAYDRVVAPALGLR